jgi:hypothetical protein
MPQRRANVKNEKQYEALKDEGMSKERAARIANSPGASSRGGKKSDRARHHRVRPTTSSAGERAPLAAGARPGDGRTAHGPRAMRIVQWKDLPG